MERATPASSAADGLADGFLWLRAETFSVLAIVIGIFLWIAVLPYTMNVEAFFPGWTTLVGMLALLVVAFALRQRWPRLAAIFLTADLLLGPAIFLLDPAAVDIVPFLFVPAVLAAGVLLSARAAFLFAGLASVAIIGARPVIGAEIDGGVALPALGIVWLAAFASWSTTKSLFTALHWAWQNSEQAERNLADARSFQARLAAALRQLEDANYRLERANHALDLARTEAESARRLKAHFAATVSHELRTPLNLVVGFSELMLNNPDAYADAPLPDAYQSDLTAVYRSARHLQGLIDDILDLSQLDAGAMPVLRDYADLAAIVAEAAATARPLLDRKGLALRVETEPGLPLVFVDRLRIRQVLLNLLNNAARFTDRGGVVVRARRDGGRETGAENATENATENGRVVVEVVDTGVGVKPEDLAKSFEPFRQLDLSPTGGRGGTGLGLAISKQFVELHGGEIWGASEGIPDRGSTFGFSLPVGVAGGGDGGTGRALAMGSSDFVRRFQSSAEPPALAIVVLDDDPAIVRLFERHLAGYRVIGAADAETAVRLAADRQALAIVVDLPPESELGAWHRRWSAIAVAGGPRVIGCPMPSGRRVARNLGLVDYLVKPVTREALLASVAAAAPSARTALVVDDDPQMVRLISRFLRSSALEIQPLRAHNGQEALDLLRIRRPDIVLLDLLMPQVDGFTVLERMRADPELAGIPVVAVSARGAVEAITPSTARTTVLIAESPLAVSQLVASIATLLSALPPTVVEPAPNEPGHRAAPAASAAF